MKKVIIFGASGTIGTALVKALMEGNYEVYGTYHERRPVQLPVERARQLSIEELGSLQTLLQEVQPDFAVMALHGDFEQQMRFHEHAARYLKENGGRMVFCSTVNVYDASFASPYVEEDRPHASTDYGRYKLACEQAMKEILGDKLAIVRIPPIYGHYSPRINDLIKKIEAEEPVQVFTNLHCTINTDSMLAGQIRFLMDEGRSGAYHLATSDIMSHAEFTKRLVQRWGYVDVVFSEEEMNTSQVLPDNKLYFALLSQVDWPNHYRITHDQAIDYLGHFRRPRRRKHFLQK